MPVHPAAYHYGPLEVYQGKDKLWRWRLKAGNNRIIADSGQGYQDSNKALKGFSAVAEAVESATRLLP